MAPPSARRDKPARPFGHSVKHATIVNQTTSTLVALIRRHYDAHPDDAGHPAYALYAEWRRRADLAENDAHPA